MAVWLPDCLVVGSLRLPAWQPACLVAWLAAWKGEYPPKINHPRTAVFAANHGVANLGVSAFPSSVTEQKLALEDTSKVIITDPSLSSECDAANESNVIRNKLLYSLNKLFKLL